MQGRHGDVLLVSVRAAMPKECMVTDKVVLADGEVTGHAHVLTAPTVYEWSMQGQRYVRVEGSGTLTHEEHGTKAIPAGTYRVIQQQETNLEGEWQRVTD